MNFLQINEIVLCDFLDQSFQDQINFEYIKDNNDIVHNIYECINPDLTKALIIKAFCHILNVLYKKYENQSRYWFIEDIELEKIYDDYLEKMHKSHGTHFTDGRFCYSHRDNEYSKIVLKHNSETIDFIRQLSGSELIESFTSTIFPMTYHDKFIRINFITKENLLIFMSKLNIKY